MLRCLLLIAIVNFDFFSFFFLTWNCLRVASSVQISHVRNADWFHNNEVGLVITPLRHKRIVWSTMNCCILPATVLKKTRTINYYPVWSIHPIRKYYGYYDVLPCKHGIRNDVPGGKSGRGDTGYANQADKDALELAMLLSFQEVIANSPSAK